MMVSGRRLDRGRRGRVALCVVALLFVGPSCGGGEQSEQVSVADGQPTFTLPLSGGRDRFALADGGDGRVVVVDGLVRDEAVTEVWTRDEGDWAGPIRLPFALLAPTVWFEGDQVVLGGHPCRRPAVDVLDAGGLAADACAEPSPYAVGRLVDGRGWQLVDEVEGTEPGSVRSVFDTAGRAWLAHQSGSDDAVFAFFRVDPSASDDVVAEVGTRSVGPDASTLFCGGVSPVWIETRRPASEGGPMVEVPQPLVEGGARITSDGIRDVVIPALPEGTSLVCEGGEARALPSPEAPAATRPAEGSFWRLAVDDRGTGTWQPGSEASGPADAVIRTWSGEPGTIAFVPRGSGETGTTYSVEVSQDGQWTPVATIQSGGIVFQAAELDDAVLVLYAAAGGFTLQEFLR